MLVPSLDVQRFCCGYYSCSSVYRRSVYLISSTSNLFSSITLLEDSPMGLPDHLPDIEIHGDDIIPVVVIRKHDLGDIRD